MSQRCVLTRPLVLARPGSEVVDWLHRNVDGFVDRREARRYAGDLLKAGYIRHTVNKVTFSEQCYYVFWDGCAGEDGGRGGRGGAAHTHLSSVPSDLADLSLLDRDEASAPPGGGDGEPLLLPPVWPHPEPRPYSPALHQQPAQGGGGGGGGR